MNSFFLNNLALFSARNKEKKCITRHILLFPKIVQILVIIFKKSALLGNILRCPNCLRMSQRDIIILHLSDTTQNP